MRTAILVFISLSVSWFGHEAAASDLHDCDIEAAHPSDPDRVGEGRASGEVVTSRAIPACRRAIDEWPDVARFHYQLGRALVYAADADGADVRSKAG